MKFGAKCLAKFGQVFLSCQQEIPLFLGSSKDYY